MAKLSEKTMRELLTKAVDLVAGPEVTDQQRERMRSFYERRITEWVESGFSDSEIMEEVEERALLGLALVEILSKVGKTAVHDLSAKELEDVQERFKSLKTRLRASPSSGTTN
jgi:hypothetical protein